MEAPFLQGVSKAVAVAGLNDLILRYPALTLTWGDRGSDVEELADSDELLVERPESAELAGWEDWSTQDED